MCVPHLHVPGDRSIRDGNGRTALHFAATGGSAEVVGEILETAPAVINSKVTTHLTCTGVKSTGHVALELGLEC